MPGLRTDHFSKNYGEPYNTTMETQTTLLSTRDQLSWPIMVPNVRPLEKKIMRWFMSQTMSSILIPDHDIPLNQKFKSMLDQKLKETPDVVSLTYSQERFVAVFRLMFPSNKRRLIASTRADRTDDGSYVQYLFHRKAGN